jgi:hypothetical protein
MQPAFAPFATQFGFASRRGKLRAFARLATAAGVDRQACYTCHMRECPLCGESMRLSVRDVQEKDGAMRRCGVDLP